MTDRLIIVESPAKANTIKKFLGGSTKVVASMGHIRNLPKSKLGVNVEKDFEPEYINIKGKGDLIKSLKKDAKDAKKVYLENILISPVQHFYIYIFCYHIIWIKINNFLANNFCIV